MALLLTPDQRSIVLPQVEQALKQRGVKFYTEEEWRASEHHRDMPFEPFMTPERAKAKAAVFDNNRIRDWLIEHRPDGAVSGTLGFLAGTAGGLADPTTLAGLGIGGKLVMNLGRTGVANLVKGGGIGALDGAISSATHDYALKQPLARWGENVTDRDILENAGWSALFGGALGTAGQGFRMLRAKPGEPGGGGGIGTKLTEQLDSSKGKPKFNDFVLGDREPGTNRLIVQGIGDEQKLIAHLETRLPWFKQQIDDLTLGIEGAVPYYKGPRVKDQLAAGAKTMQGRPPQTLSDLMGGRIMVESGRAIDGVMQRIEQRFRVLQRDDFMSAPKGGYRGVHLQIDLGDGTSAELQIVPKRFIDSGSFDFDHKIYDKWKRIDRDIMTDEQAIKMRNERAEGIRRLNEDWNQIRHRFELP